MKIISLIIFLFGSYSFVHGQYKNMTVGVFGGTHNFKSNYFNTGLSVQYNFRKAISINSGLSYERMTFETSEKDLYAYTGTSFHANWTIPYVQIPLNVRATFGRKFCVFFEFGGAYTFFEKITSEYIYSNSLTANTFKYEHEKINLFMLTLGGGICVPLTDNLLIQFTAKRSLLSYDYLSGYDYISSSVVKTPGFINIKYMLGIAYQFNFKKKKEYPIDRLKILKY